MTATGTCTCTGDCCCGGDAVPAVPRPRDNPPGLARIGYRVGTHSGFKAAMLSRLGRTGSLRRLTVREDDDPTIALLDGWATVLDVLGFYQQEVANEGYLRTAEERLSVARLADAIGYSPAPGVSAETWLAFDCEPTPATPEECVIPAGTQAQSTPAPGETPQIFETKQDLTGRPAWNALRPRLTRPAPVNRNQHTVYLAGTSTGLEPGQPLLFLADNAADDPGSAVWDLRWIRSIETFTPPRPDDPRPAHTKVRLDRRIRRLRDIHAAEIHALRQRAAAFGHNAMRWADLPLPLRVGELHPDSRTFLAGPYANSSGSWAGAAYASTKTQLFLDQVYRRLVAGGWAVLSAPGATALFAIDAVTDRTHNEFLIAAKATRLTLNGDGIQNFSPRTATVWCESERMAPAEEPIIAAVSGDAVTLNGLCEGIEKGRMLAFRGLAEGSLEAVAEVVQVKSVQVTSAGLTRLVLETALVHSYDRLSLRINANVVAANAGARRGEILGDGNAAIAFQRFRLQSVPLAHVSSSTGTGSVSTLQVRVDGQLWTEVPALHGRGTEERVYTVRLDDDGAATVMFGDGRTAGARPASGNSNVTASLRVGGGTDGNLPAGRIDQLPARPLGVKGVVNPVPATGAANPEGASAARRNAPLHTRLIDRIVSLRDYEDFARGFAGIEKALAQTLWAHGQRLVHVTVAGADGATVPPGTTLHDNLREALDLARHSDEPAQLGTHQTRLFRLAADLRIAADLIPEDVVAAARAAVAAAFSFDARAFGQAVSRAEVAAVLHAVPGVEGVIFRTLRLPGNAGPEVQDMLPARLARMTGNGLAPAELLLADLAALDLTGAI